MAETALNNLPPAAVGLPGMALPIIAKDRLGLAQWGWPYAADKRPLINIRSETVATKPLFAKDWQAGHRCIAPATGFFEKGHFFTAPSSDLFGLCGLWTKDTEGQPCFALLTREASAPVSAIHHRMPVAIRPEEAAAWLSGGSLPPPAAFNGKSLAAAPALL